MESGQKKMLDESDALLTIAEVAATFAGFAALVTLFGRRRVAASALHDLLRLRLVIGASVITVVAALIPVAVAGYGLSADIVWRGVAAVFLVLRFFVIGSFLTSYRSVRGTFAADRLAVSVAFVLELFILAGLIAVILNLVVERHFGLYVSALIGTIAQAAFVFLRLVESTFGNIVMQVDDNQK